MAERSLSELNSPANIAADGDGRSRVSVGQAKGEMYRQLRRRLVVQRMPCAMRRRGHWYHWVKVVFEWLSLSGWCRCWLDGCYVASFSNPPCSRRGRWDDVGSVAMYRSAVGPVVLSAALNGWRRWSHRGVDICMGN